MRLRSLMAKMTISGRRSSSLFIVTFGIVSSKEVCILLVIFSASCSTSSIECIWLFICIFSNFCLYLTQSAFV